jgi:hypothetical protein
MPLEAELARVLEDQRAIMLLEVLVEPRKPAAARRAGSGRTPLGSAGAFGK